MFMKYLRFRLMKPLDGDGDDLGGGEDRGDNLPDNVDKSGAGGEDEAAAAEKLEKELKDEADAKAAKEAEEKKAKGEGDENEDAPGDTDEEKAAKAAARKDKRIPLSRHTAILQKEREARQEVERQLAETRAGKTIAATNEVIAQNEAKIIELEKEYAQLITDGKGAEAATKMGEIRKLDRAVSEARSDFKIQAAEANAVERTRYGIALERIEEANPKLNPDHDDFDETLQDEVADLAAAYRTRGMTATQALQKAVKLLVEPTTKRQQAAVDTSPRVNADDLSEEDKKAAAAAEETKKKREADARKKAAETIAKTPASTTKTGLNSDAAGGGLDAKSVMNMGQDDFNKLPEEALSRLRGDTL